MHFKMTAATIESESDDDEMPDLIDYLSSDEELPDLESESDEDDEFMEEVLNHELNDMLDANTKNDAAAHVVGVEELTVVAEEESTNWITDSASTVDVTGNIKMNCKTSNHAT